MFKLLTLFCKGEEALNNVAYFSHSWYEIIDVAIFKFNYGNHT